MADIDEEIIIIEDSDALPDQLSSDYETSQKKPSKKKRKPPKNPNHKKKKKKKKPKRN